MEISKTETQESIESISVGFIKRLIPSIDLSRMKKNTQISITKKKKKCEDLTTAMAGGRNFVMDAYFVNRFLYSELFVCVAPRVGGFIESSCFF